MLEASLQKTFPGFDLDVSLSCDQGVTILFGPSGAGKTLTLNVLAGLVRPDTGRILLNKEILFDAQRNVDVPPRSRGAAYVFQNDALFPHMTVEENLVFPLAKLGPIERRRRSRALMDTFRIAQLAARYPRDLSGGEKQRATLARALGNGPRLLLLDEPARGLDHELRMDLYQVLADVRAQYQVPILLVTHDREEAFRLGERLMVYHAGRIVQSGSAEQVFAAPGNHNVARLLGYTNIFEGTIERLDPSAGTSRVRAGDVVLTLDYLPGRLLGDRVEMCIPPQGVKLGAGENQFPAEFISDARLPNTVRVTFRAGGLGDMECEMPREGYVAPAKSVTLSLPRGAVHVFEKGVSA